MPTNPAFDEYFQQAAARLAQNRNMAQTNVWANYKPITSQTKPTEGDIGGNVGQGIIDFLSTGTYAVAGVGQRIGESFSKLGQGDLSNVLPDIVGLGFAQGLTSGVRNKRTWSDNLKALGADEATAAGVGLGLDIVLDPTWLIPGGMVAKGITGTARGISVASRLIKEGVKLTPEAVKGVQAATEGFVRPGLRNLPKQTGEFGVLADVLKPTGQKISAVSPQGLQNFYEGIKQANIENHSEWIAARAAEKVNYYRVGVFRRKRPEYRAALKEARTIEDIAAASELGIPPATHLANNAEQAAETVVKATEEKVAKQTVPNDLKDAGSEQDIVEATARKGKKTETTVPVKDEPIYTQSARELGKYREEWQKRMGLDVSNIDYAAVKASVDAPEIAKIYDRLISDPTNPEVQAAYKKFVEESRQQYDYLTKELGIKVEYVKEDPYNIVRADGTSVPDSRLMMEDVLKNKTLKVRDSAIDFVNHPHPLLTAEENNIFRAVHDFFGHAASGRSFNADGEEAAWIAHSSMFSPEARRAMTTETRGQNSYYNFFDPNNKQFAEQKAALFPEEYTLLPSELDLITGQALTTNTFFGRLTNVLSEVADNVLDELGRVETPLKNEKLYTPEQITNIKQEVDAITSKGKYDATTPIHKEIVAALNDLIDKLNSPVIGTGFVESLQNFKAKGGKALELLQQVLDRPIVITSLLKDLAKAEGRELAAPEAFKATFWGAKNGKTSFTTETLAKYFADDELLSDPKKLGIAMGKTPLKEAKVYVRKGETLQQAYLRYQSAIWEDFRARNAENLNAIAEKEKADWDLKWQQAESEIFTQTSAGQLVGVGKLPAKLPFSVIAGSFNGLPATTLGKMLENIGAMIERAPQRAIPGTAISTLSGDVGEIGIVFGEPAFLKGFDFEAKRTPEGLIRFWQENDINQELSKAEQLKLAKATLDADEGNLALAMDSTSLLDQNQFIDFIKNSKIRGAEFAVVDKNGEKISGIVTAITTGKKLPAGAKLIAVNDTAKKVLQKLRKTKPEIAVDKLDENIKLFMIGNLSDTIFNITKNGIRDLTSSLSKADIEANASKLLSSGVVKTLADARLAITGGADALRVLEAKPAMKLYVKDRTRLRSTSLAGKREMRQMVTRDPRTGLPIDASGKIVSEKEAEKLLPGVNAPQFRMVTDTGADFTGRSAGAGSTFAEQGGKGRQQLAAIQAVREAIGSINTGIKAKEFIASPEQANLLTNVMVSLGIKVADNLSPEAVFKQFQKEAAPAFDEMISKIQSAAKTESVIYQARAVFNKSIEENISLMKAIEALDPGELQAQVVKFTEDAISLVDDFCAMQYAAIGGPKLSATEFLQQISKGSIGKVQ